MIKIKIPVHFQEKPSENDQEDNYKQVLREIKGVSSTEEPEYFTKEVAFYHIDCVSPNVDTEDNQISVIYSGGMEFTSPLSLEEVEALIDKALKSGK